MDNAWFGPSKHTMWPRRSGKTVMFEDHIQPILQRGERVLLMRIDGYTSLRMDDPCDEWAVAQAPDPQACRIGSCRRHRECMYRPCRN